MKHLKNAAQGKWEYLVIIAIIALGSWQRLHVACANYALADPLSEQYFEIGRSAAHTLRIAEGRTPTALRNILYPSLIALAEWLWRPLIFGKLRLLLAVLSTFIVGIVWRIGRTHSRFCGLLAALLVAFDPAQIDYCRITDVYVFFSFLLALAAWAMVRWSRKPTDRNLAWFGIAVAMSLNCRSTLSLFPFFLLGIIWTWSWASGDAAQTYWHGLKRNLWILLAACFLPSAPWLVRNAFQFHAFIPFEKGLTAEALFSSSLGIVGSQETQVAWALSEQFNPALAGAVGDKREIGMRRLAIDNILSDPIRYLASSIRRLKAILGYESRPRLHLLDGWDRVYFLVLPILVAIPILSGNFTMSLLGFLVLYYVGIHATMPVRPAHFVPLGPLLAVLSAGALSAATPWTKPSRRDDPLAAASRADSKAFLILMSIPLALYAVALFLIATDLVLTERYQFPAGGIGDNPSAVSVLAGKSALCRPEAKNISDRGTLSLLSEKPAEAIAAFRRAIQKDPACAEAYINLGVALEESGSEQDALSQYNTAQALLPRSDIFLDTVSNRRFLLLTASNRAESVGNLTTRLNAARASRSTR